MSGDIMRHQNRLVPLFIAAAFMLGACASTPTQESTGEHIDDAAITAKVNSALIEDPQVKARPVDVETARGVVQLSGFVDDSGEKQTAEMLARNVAGVQKVDNQLEVKSTTMNQPEATSSS